MSFAGRTAVVTGATGGIGAAVAARARRCRRDGARPRPAAAGADGLVWHRVDLGDDAAVAGFAARGSAAELDLLVHAAGVHATGAVATLPVAELDRQWRINLRAPYLLTQALLPPLAARRGQVAFLNSSVWGNARAGMAAYAGAKFALKALADALRAEVNPAGLRVLSLFPGRTASPDAGRGARRRGRALPARGAAAARGRRRDARSPRSPCPRTAEVTDIHIRPARQG